MQAIWDEFNRISEPLAFEKPAFARGRALLELACRGVTGHRARPAFQNLFRESALPERLALLAEIMPGLADLWSAVGAIARISLAGNRPFGIQKDVWMASLKFSRQADVHSVEFLGQDMPDQVALVTALHDDDEHAGLGIVQSRR